MPSKLQSAKQRAARLKRKSALRIRRARRHVLLLPIMSGICLAVVALAVLATLRLTGTSSVLTPTDTTSVQISYDKQSRVVPTTAKTVGELLDKLDIHLHSGDTVEPAIDTEIFGDNFRVNVYRGRPVVVIDGKQKIYAVSSATTPRSIAKQVGLTVYPEDKLTVDPAGNFLQNYALGKQISIEKSVPINVNLYGRFTAMRTLASTVGELLVEKHIDLPKGSSVFPARGTKVKPNMQVFVTSEGMKIEVTEEEIPMPVETVSDNNLSFGVTAVRQQGSPGKRLVTYQVNEKTGKRTKLQEFIAQDPVTQIVARGRAISIPANKRSIMAQAGIRESDFPYVDYIISRESGWCPTKVQGHYGSCPSYVPTIPNHGGYGLCQSTPGSKMASAGSDWRSNAVTQLRWCSNYAAGKGGWEASYNFWVSHHWW